MGNWVNEVVLPLIYDVVVVGAGPAGLTLAQTVAEAGFSVILCEEHATVGSPPHCTGKISTNALRELSIKAKGKLTEIKGAKFFSPKLNSLTIKRKSSQAVIVDREIFDQHLADKAISVGAHLLTRSRVIDVNVGKTEVITIYKLGGRTRSIRSRIVVGSDGVPSIIAKSQNLAMSHNEMRLGIQREVENFEISPCMVEVFLGSVWAPNFFAWIVPTSNTSARIGLAMPLQLSKASVSYLNNFIERHPLVKERVKESRCIRQSAHLIPTGGPPVHTVADGKLLVGDAAGQVKSTTGGGLFIGMSCAIIAGKVIATALSEGEGVLRTSQLTDYDEEWRIRFGQEIEFSVHMRRFLDSLTDDEVDYLFDVINQNETLRKTIEAKGDIDRQSKISLLSLQHIMYFVKKPRLFYKITKLLTRFTLR